MIVACIIKEMIAPPGLSYMSNTTHGKNIARIDIKIRFIFIGKAPVNKTINNYSLSQNIARQSKDITNILIPNHNPYANGLQNEYKHCTLDAHFLSVSSKILSHQTRVTA